MFQISIELPTKKKLSFNAIPRKLFRRKLDLACPISHLLSVLISSLYLLESMM